MLMTKLFKGTSPNYRNLNNIKIKPKIHRAITNIDPNA